MSRRRTKLPKKLFKNWIGETIWGKPKLFNDEFIEIKKKKGGN